MVRQEWGGSVVAVCWDPSLALAGPPMTGFEVGPVVSKSCEDHFQFSGARAEESGAAYTEGPPPAPTRSRSYLAAHGLPDRRLYFFVEELDQPPGD